MKTLESRSFQRAAGFIRTRARPLEQSLMNHRFFNGPASACHDELTRFLTPDGGFRSIEADFASPAATVLNTVHALEILARTDTSADHPLVSAAMGYITAQYDHKLNAWRIIPVHDNAAPHAPWWHYDGNFDRSWKYFVDNPRPKILAFAYRYPDYLPAAVQDEAAVSVHERITSMKQGEITKDSLDCYVALFEQRGIPAHLRDILETKIPVWIDEILERNPANWDSYCLKPLDVFRHPDSTYIDQYADLVEQNLQYDIDEQTPDGSWLPNWDWAGTFPGAWEDAKVKWQGVLTLQRLYTLASFGRIAYED